MFIYKRRIHVYETDLMGIVHHSNFLRFCEEARVEWFRQNGYDLLDRAEIFGLAVVETIVQHKLPIRYIDSCDIKMQLKVKGPRLIIQYKLFSQEKVYALAETTHCRINEKFKVLRLENKVTQLVEKEIWTETWL